MHASDFVCGNGIGRYPDIFLPLNRRGAFLAPGLTDASSEAYAFLAGNAQYGRDDLEPLYIRPCDAVDNLDRISSRRGIAPDAARRRYAELLLARPASDL